MLGLAADYMEFGKILRIIDKWLETNFGLNKDDEACIRGYIQTVRLKNSINIC